MEANEKETKSIARLLAKTTELAEQTGLTGCYENGAGRCVWQYNASVSRLEELGAIPKGFFLPLPSDASFGEVGVASAQLGSYIDADAGGQETGVTYKGPKYNILNQYGGVSEEERKELAELQALLRAQRAHPPQV